MNIVIVGHVDHGKSTVIGRLLADTNSLPEGKLQHVQEMCKRNAKPFEYAFLLDALKDERSQGITIDIARCFFKTHKRDYLILDAPGHIEFLKNMVTGAAHAEAALLVIDANEGIQDNSKRHGYLVSMLGIKQVVVLVNKMDLVKYDQAVFEKIVADYSQFLRQMNVEAITFIPISAVNGENIVAAASSMPWYVGGTVLEHMDTLQKAASDENLPLRLPVQDIYKFTQMGDDRRIIAGTVLTGSVQPGDDVQFLPSGKRTTIKSIESFHAPMKMRALAGEAVGLTMTTQIYIARGEMMAKVKEKQPIVTSRFRANIFWVGRDPLVKQKNYKLKIGAAKTPVRVVEMNAVLDATTLCVDTEKKHVDRNEVAECVFETAKPIAFDLSDQTEKTARFVLIDAYEIAGGGIILNGVTPGDATAIAPQAGAGVRRGKMIVLVGDAEDCIRDVSLALEKQLSEEGVRAVCWRPSAGMTVMRVSEVARILTDAGQLLITTIGQLNGFDIEKLRTSCEPCELMLIHFGENRFGAHSADLHFSQNEEAEKSASAICAFYSAPTS